MARLFLCFGACLGGSGVMAGAFASHALRGSLAASSLSTFETAARYQLLHALALLVVGVLLYGTDDLGKPARTSLGWSGGALGVGVILFSGSLYGLSLGLFRGLGWVTPLGGVSLMLGWGMLAIAALQLPPQT